MIAATERTIPNLFPECQRCSVRLENVRSAIGAYAEPSTADSIESDVACTTDEASQVGNQVAMYVELLIHSSRLRGTTSRDQKITLTQEVLADITKRVRSRVVCPGLLAQNSRV